MTSDRPRPSGKTSREIPETYDLEEYTFELPEAQVKQYPDRGRHDSRLMVLDRASGSVRHSRFRNLGDFLPEGALLVLNASKVFPARLLCAKEGTGGKAEFLLLTPLAFIAPTAVTGQWAAAEVQGLVKPARSIRPGQRLWCGPDLTIRPSRMGEHGRVAADLSWRGDLHRVLEAQGRMPLPPYIKRTEEPVDRTRYQTIYAREDKCGSVAAPTAGLHFSPETFASLEAKGIQTAELTLYVSHGTFEPVRSRDIRRHRMHEEYYEISEACARAVRQAKAEGRPVVAVGTTSVRTLESAWRDQGAIVPCSGLTDLFIAPGFRFAVVDQMLTNFHLPKSSLLIMVAAFAGKDRILEAYAEAVHRGYTFFSYGDAMLIL